MKISLVHPPRHTPLPGDPPGQTKPSTDNTNLKIHHIASSEGNHDFCLLLLNFRPFILHFDTSGANTGTSQSEQ